jgi:hypothetical protein
VDPRAGLDDLRSENFLPYRDSNTDPSVAQPIVSRYTEYVIPAPLNIMYIKQDEG